MRMQFLRSGTTGVVWFCQKMGVSAQPYLR